MRNNIVLAAAVAASLAASVASAANYDIYVSGSSAAKTFFQKDVQNFFGGSTTAPAVIYNYKDPALASTVGQPDYSAIRVAVANTQSISGLLVGDIVTVHYAAELGSVWGVAGAYNSLAQTRAQLFPGTGGLTADGCGTTPTTSTTGVTTYTCAGSAFNHVTDTDGGTLMPQKTADILVSDVEPALFNANLGDNWPTANFDATLKPTKLGAVPTTAQLNTAKSNMSRLVGQVFAVIGHGIPGYADNQYVNLSSTSIRSILTGAYATWNQVPEVGGLDTATGGTAINVCRRDHGSGTEIGASLTFTGIECGQKGANTILGQLGPSPSDFQELPSTTDMVSCVTGTPGSIGIRSVTAPASNLVVFNIDGVQANAHNAAAGAYPYAYEAWAGLTGAQASSSPTAAAIAAKLLARSASDDALGLYSSFKETVTTNGAPFLLTAGTAPSPVYGIVGLGATGSPTGTANAETAATLRTNTSVVTSLFDRSGNSCTAKYNGNN